MSIFICPGFHSSQFTQCFKQELLSGSSSLDLTEKIRIFPAQSYTTLSALHILQELINSYGQPAKSPPIVFISFSAGVVGAMGAAWGWESMGGSVKAAIAIDGWGVPLGGNFPIHRLSHDYFTHATSIVLNRQTESFYADPAVEHLQMWRSPSTVRGWATSSIYPQERSYLNASEFILMLLKRYREIE